MGYTDSKFMVKNRVEKDVDFFGNIFQLYLFSGIGSIENENSSYKDVINYFGFPNADMSDDRGNRILEYKNNGLYFKFLKNFSETGNPKLSFITVKKPYKCRKDVSVFPGLRKRDVHSNMTDFTLENSYDSIEIWKNSDAKHVKFLYDKRQRLETILMY